MSCPRVDRRGKWLNSSDQLRLSQVLATKSEMHLLFVHLINFSKTLLWDICTCCSLSHVTYMYYLAIKINSYI